MLSFALLELCGPDAWDPTGLRLCVGPFPFRDLQLSCDPVLFVAPPESTGPDASDPMVRSFAGDINFSFSGRAALRKLWRSGSPPTQRRHSRKAASLSDLAGYAARRQQEGFAAPCNE
jgi:hypothetical protein